MGKLLFIATLVVWVIISSIQASDDANVGINNYLSQYSYTDQILRSQTVDDEDLKSKAFFKNLKDNWIFPVIGIGLLLYLKPRKISENKVVAKKSFSLPVKLILIGISGYIGNFLFVSKYLYSLSSLLGSVFLISILVGIILYLYSLFSKKTG